MTEAAGPEPGIALTKRQQVTRKFILLLSTWLSAFAVVMLLLGVFGQQLQRTPIWVRALTLSGLLVFLMGLVIQPTLIRLFSLLWRRAETSREQAVRSGAGRTS